MEWLVVLLVNPFWFKLSRGCERFMKLITSMLILSLSFCCRVAIILACYGVAGVMLPVTISVFIGVHLVQAARWFAHNVFPGVHASITTHCDRKQRRALTRWAARIESKQRKSLRASRRLLDKHFAVWALMARILVSAVLCGVGLCAACVMVGILVCASWLLFSIFLLGFGEFAAFSGRSFNRNAGADVLQPYARCARMLCLFAMPVMEVRYR